MLTRQEQDALIKNHLVNTVLLKFQDGILRATVKFKNRGCTEHLFNPYTGKAVCGIDTGVNIHDVSNVTSKLYGEVDCKRCEKIYHTRSIKEEIALKCGDKFTIQGVRTLKKGKVVINCKKGLETIYTAELDKHAKT